MEIRRSHLEILIIIGLYLAISKVVYLQCEIPVDTARIAALLQPFLSSAVEILSFRAKLEGPQSGPSSAVEESAVLSPAQLQSISIYIDLLLRWNARINLTSIRDPEQIVTRHFGESLFAAHILFPASVARALLPAQPPETKVWLPHPSRFSKGGDDTDCLIDLGSGAGFPGLPIKIWTPSIHLTLIESNNKKVAFLREAMRALALTDVNVFSGRAESYPLNQQPNTTVALRAVENFVSILPAAARIVPPCGRLALLIGERQVDQAKQLLPNFTWSNPTAIPLSTSRVLVIGANQEGHVPEI